MEREYPERPWVGIGVVVWRGHDVLLVRRGRPPRLGQWGLPGGAQHVGETVFEAAVREVFEETGLQIRPYDIITAVDGISRDPSGRVQYHYTLVEVAAEALPGDAVAGDDAAAVHWAAVEDLERLLEWEETAQVIRLSAARRNGRPAEADGTRRSD